MTQTGSLTKVYIGLEAVEGVRAATLIPLEVDTFNENDKPVPAERQGAKNSINEIHGSEIVEESSEPQLSGDISDQVLGLFLLGLFGAVSTTDDSPEAGVYTHDFTVLNSNNHPTFSIVFYDKDVDGGAGECRECLGCQIDTAEIPLDAGSFGKFDIKFLGRISQSGTDPNTSYLDENFFVTPSAKFKIADNAGGLAAATPLAVQTGKLMITKNGKKQFVMGSTKNPAKCYNGRARAKMETTIEYLNDSYIELERDSTQKSARLELTSSAVIGAVTNPLIQIDFELCTIRELTRDRNVAEELRQSFGTETENFTAMTAKLINAKASYVAD